MTATRHVSPTFILLTDFGLTDQYVGQLRLALTLYAPAVPILDLAHDVPPFAISTGAFFLASSLPFFPDGAILLAVVDPGVGSMRELLLIQGCMDDRVVTLIGPDNGLLSLGVQVLERYGPPVRCFSLTKAGNSNTFHGRSILAPFAARLARGEAPESLGTPRQKPLHTPSWIELEAIPDGFSCHVIHVDRFGNCILNLPAATLLPEDVRLLPMLVTEANGEFTHYELQKATCYAAITESKLGLVLGSQGFYEIASNRSSAAALTGLRPEDRCRIIFPANESDSSTFWSNLC